MKNRHSDFNKNTPNGPREHAILSIISEIETSMIILRKQRVEYANNICRYVLLSQKRF